MRRVSFCSHRQDVSSDKQRSGCKWHPRDSQAGGRQMTGHLQRPYSRRQRERQEGTRASFQSRQESRDQEVTGVMQTSSIGCRWLCGGANVANWDWGRQRWRYLKCTHVMLIVLTSSTIIMAFKCAGRSVCRNDAAMLKWTVLNGVCAAVISHFRLGYI